MGLARWPGRKALTLMLGLLQQAPLPHGTTNHVKTRVSAPPGGRQTDALVTSFMTHAMFPLLVKASFAR